MSKLEEYRAKLALLDDWIPFLRRNSGLPGPRGNLELAQAVAEQATHEWVERLLSTPRAQAPENSPGVFLVFCGITALGKLAARGAPGEVGRLRQFASDDRWRVREAVAIALQYVGDADMHALLTEMEAWSTGNWYEKRAAAAALAEPRLLKQPDSAREVLRILDRITLSMQGAKAGRDASYQVLRKSMGYCWSVAAAALPQAGLPLMEKWMQSQDADILWIMRENLKKNRLSRVDAVWVDRCLQHLKAGG